MPSYVVTSAAKPRFQGDFAIVPQGAHIPTPEEQAYLDALTRVLDSIANDEAAAKESSGTRPALLGAQLAHRTATTTELRKQAEAFAAGTLPPIKAIDQG